MRAPALRARENPFRVQRVDALRYRLDGGAGALLDRFEALGRRAAVVGPHGSGKTSLLEHLRPRLAERGLRTVSLRFRRGERAEAGEAGQLGAGAGTDGIDRTVFLLDGIDVLAALARWRLLRASRAAAGVLVAAHRDVGLPVVHRCAPGPELLADLVAELHSGCGCVLPPLAALFARHGGNLRTALRELYDLHA
jgi:hypothetical protein